MFDVRANSITAATPATAFIVDEHAAARRPTMVIVTSLWLVQLRETVCPQNFDDQTYQWLCFVDYWRTRYSLRRTLTVSALGAMR